MRGKKKTNRKHLQGGDDSSESSVWKEAANKEILSLKKHGVYELVTVFSVPSF